MYLLQSGILKTGRWILTRMNVVLAEGTAKGAEAVQTGIINSAGAIIGLVGLLLVAAWWAYLYR